MDPSLPNHHQKHVCKRGTVDCVSRHRTLEILSRFGDRGWHVDASGASDQDRTGNYRGIVGSWPTIITRSRSSIGPHRIERSAFFARNFLINTDVLPLYLNSWLIVKQLSDFEGISWVHRDSLHSRLNRDQIEAGFVAIHCKDWSKSLLERRNHVEDLIDWILFNPRELKPNLLVNRVSSVIRSFSFQ